MAITAEQMLPTRRKISCSSSRKSQSMDVMWEGLAGRPRHSQECWLLAGWHLEPWQRWLKPVTNLCHLLKPRIALGTTLVHRGRCAVPLQPLPSPFHLCCSSLVLLGLHRGSDTCWHGPGWRICVCPLEAAKMPEKYKDCLTKHLRVGVLRSGEHIPPCSHIACAIHPSS